MTRVLILGATGMLGHGLLRELSKFETLDVYGTARDTSALTDRVPPHVISQVFSGVAADADRIGDIMADIGANIVVNCIGLIKQHELAVHPAEMIRLNSLFPHTVAKRCASLGARLIHVSTDCVFSGAAGGYTEESLTDSRDLYGLSKLLGETVAPPALTIRTSVIGHELRTARSLVDWFLSQSGTVTGFRKAIYSGLTATEFGRMLATHVFPHAELSGLYHVASEPISKYDLLLTIAEVYDWRGVIVPSDEFRSDRTLCADRFFRATQYQPPAWDSMIRGMHRAEAEWSADA